MLSITTSKVAYTGNGSVSVYDYTFKIFDDDDLVVTVRNLLSAETILTKTTDYTVTGVGLSSGTRQVTLVSSGQAWLTAGKLTSGYLISIRRVNDLIQETDLRNGGTYYPEDVEDQFDKQVMVDQQQQDEIDRSVRLPETVDDSDFDPILPATIGDAASANKVLWVNDDADGFELVEASEVAALTAQASHTVTDNQAATALTGETVDSAAYSSVVYEYEIKRGTTVFSVGRFSLHYRDSAWYVVLWSDNMDDAAVAHGVTFSVTGTTTAQLKAALDTGAGNGTIKLKRHKYSA